MSKYKVGEIVEIVYGSKMWDGKREVIECNDESVTTLSNNGAQGLFYFKDVKKLRIDNWRKRII